LVIRVWVVKEILFKMILPAISIQSVTKKFKDTVALSDLSLEIKQSEYVPLLGSNGAGKTTLVEIILEFL